MFLTTSFGRMKKSRAIGFLAGAGLGLLFFGFFQIWQNGTTFIEEAAKLEHTLSENGNGSEAVAGSNIENAAQREEAEQQKDIKKIALTFDDGPHPYYTDQLLDGLKERGVVATFFVTGEHASLHPETIERMAEEGHLIGNHTYSHMQLTTDNEKEFKEELVKTNEVIREITGKEVLYVRPPYGVWNKKFEAELNMFPVLWTVDPLDWCSDNAYCIAAKVIADTEENDIILMHDYYATSVTAALEIVDELLKEGYTFVTVDEILFD